MVSANLETDQHVCYQLYLQSAASGKKKEQKTKTKNLYSEKTFTVRLS